MVVSSGLTVLLFELGRNTLVQFNAGLMVTVGLTPAAILRRKKERPNSYIQDEEIDVVKSYKVLKLKLQLFFLQLCNGVILFGRLKI